MGAAILVLGEADAAGEFARRLAPLVPDAVVTGVEQPFELAERAAAAQPALVLVLKGAIAGHDDRIRAIASLRAGGFRGPVVVEGSFLSERSDALAAGADHAFRTPDQVAERVVAAALRPTRVAADHAWLRALLVGEWVAIEPLGDRLPEEAPDLLLTATSCRARSGGFSELAEWSQAHGDCRVVIVQDGEDEELAAEALSAGGDHYVELGEDGIGALLELARGAVRELWRARVAAA